jgi:hypothetical protein
VQERKEGRNEKVKEGERKAKVAAAGLQFFLPIHNRTVFHSERGPTEHGGA